MLARRRGARQRLLQTSFAVSPCDCTGTNWRAGAPPARRLATGKRGACPTSYKLSPTLLQHCLVKLMPVVEIVQIYRVFWRRGIIRNTACSKDILARLVVVDITAYRGVMLLDRLLV